jgi:hypothetical protein
MQPGSTMVKVQAQHRTGFGQEQPLDEGSARTLESPVRLQ